ncbi:MAG: CDP-alcohol phosphatidyltransferase family protein [Ilumatobacteraceae bacterium]
MKPLGQLLRRTGLSPDHLTIAGLLVGVGAAFCVAQGWFLAGLALVILAALPDLLDGALAKATNASSQRGAYFDSVIDRVTDALMFGGLAWYYASGDTPRLAVLPFGVMAVSSVISYQRAKAESLGLDAKGGLMERAERVILLCFGLLVSPLLVWVLWVMLALTVVTAIQRFFKVWRQAAVAPVTAARIELRRSRRQSRRVARSERMAQVRVRRRRPQP